MPGQATSDEIQRIGTTNNKKKENKGKKKNFGHFIFTLKCVKQKLWNAVKVAKSKKDFSTACSSC